MSKEKVLAANGPMVCDGLGLRKVNQVVERPDTPGLRGMVKKIPHLLEVVE